MTRRSARSLGTVTGRAADRVGVKVTDRVGMRVADRVRGAGPVRVGLGRVGLVVAVVLAGSACGSGSVDRTRLETSAASSSASSAVTSSVSGTGSSSSGTGSVSGSPSTASARSGTATSPGRGASSPTAHSGAARSGTAAGVAGGRWWRPSGRPSWQLQYSGTVNLSLDVQVYDLDVDSTSAAQVKALHAAGRKVICYVDAGASESYRSDAASFPAAVLGSVMDGWPDERWLDIRQQSVILPILAKRFDTCRAKGFDAVDPDNLNGYTNETGFPLTAADQSRFNRAVAALAHERGLAVGLKNDVEQAAELQPSFDFAVNEQCIEYAECDAYTSFISAGKPVFSVEYTGTPATVCATANKLGLITLIKNLDLDATRRSC